MHALISLVKARYKSGNVLLGLPRLLLLHPCLFFFPLLFFFFCGRTISVMKISWLCLFTVIDVALTYERKQFEHHILIKTHIRKTRWLGLQAFQQPKATRLAAMFYVMFRLHCPSRLLQCWSYLLSIPTLNQNVYLLAINRSIHMTEIKRVFYYDFDFRGNLAFSSA